MKVTNATKIDNVMDNSNKRASSQSQGSGKNEFYSNIQSGYKMILASDISLTSSSFLLLLVLPITINVCFDGPVDVSVYYARFIYTLQEWHRLIKLLKFADQSKWDFQESNKKRGRIIR